MADWQSILVYITLALALGYLVRKYALPALWKSKKTGGGSDCGSPDCGCH